MILPIGHENQSVRRIPWVTIAIIGICLLIHIIVTEKMDKSVMEVAKHGGKYMEYYFSHPYLELDPEIEKMLFSTPEQKKLFQSYIDRRGMEEPSDSVIEMEQEEFDALYLNFKRALDNIPHMKWGYTPAKKKFSTLISSMFVHAGWWHLIFNMLFLYLLAPYIEDIWGMPVFAVFYVLMGIMSTTMHAAHYPQSMVPLVGASGAISGVMGAFLVNYWNTKIRFVFLFALVGGTFSAPAWLMLPLYLIKEFLSARTMDTLKVYGYEGGGVAHWVHVWGFVFGFLVAFAIKFFKFDEKFLAKKIDAKTTFVNESANAVEKAMEMVTAGEMDQAYTLMLETVRKDPYNSDVVEALWNLGVDTNRLETVAPYLQKLVEKEVRSGQLAPALSHYRPLKENAPETAISTSAKISLLGQMVTQKEFKEADAFGEEIAREISLDMPPGLLIAFCNSMSAIDLELNQTKAQPVFQIAMGHPEIPESTKEDLKKRLFQKRLPGQGESIPVPGQEKSAGGGARLAAGLAAAGAAGLSAGGPAGAGAPGGGAKNVATGGATGVSADSGTLTLDFTSSLDLDEEPPPPPPVELPTSPPPIPDIPGTAGDVELSLEGPPPVPDSATVDAGPPPIPGNDPGSQVTPPPVMEPGAPRPGEMVISLDDDPGKEKSGGVSAGESGGVSAGESGGVSAGESGRDSTVLAPPIKTPPAKPPAEKAPSPPAPPPLEKQVVKREISPTKSVPMGVKEGRLAINVDKVGHRALPLKKIKAISVAKITPQAQGAFLLIDLFLDDPTTTLTAPPGQELVKLRSLRVLSTDFNPQSFIPNTKNLTDAYRMFTSGVLKMSGCTALPDADAVQLQKMAVFPTIEAYEKAILG